MRRGEKNIALIEVAAFSNLPSDPLPVALLIKPEISLNKLVLCSGLSPIFFAFEIRSSKTSALN